MNSYNDFTNKLENLNEANKKMMVFKFKTEKKYKEAYSKMLRMTAPFVYNIGEKSIEVDPTMFDFDIVENALNKLMKEDS